MNKRICGIALVAVALAVVGTNAANGANAAVTAAKPEKALPKVLIIGDSISLGYTPIVKEKLKGVADVSRPPCNCGPSQFVLRSMKNRDWAGGAHWDVIHVNFGIWDNHYLTGSSGSLDGAQLYREKATNASPIAVGTAIRDMGYRIRTPVKAYERNLRAILAYLMTRADRVVFALSTPLTGWTGDDRCGRIRVYNELAADVCRELGVEVDDLYSVAERHLDQQVDGCHFSPAGYAFLADAVAASVRTALNGGSGAPRRLLTLTTGRGNARNGEGDLVWLKDGSILFVYGEWTDDLQLDEAQAHIVARRSSDHGRTWTPAREVFPREGRQNDMSVSLLRLADGRLALFNCRKNSDADCMPVVRFSSDEAKTWSAPVDCMPEAERDYYVLNNARVVQLKSGRILAPLAKHSPKDDNPGAGRLSCVFSDDGGRTWRKGREYPVFKPDGKRVTVQEPGVIELKDGRVYMYVRTGEGRQWQAFSKDGGETWTDFGPSPLFGPLAPATIRRAPDGRLLAVWNDHEGHPEYVHRGGWGRVPLTLAFSSDEGKTWKDKRVIEPDLEGFNCYIATLFDGDDLLLHYYCNQPGLTDSCVTRVPGALKSEAAEDLAALRAAAREDMAHAVRPGGVDGRPFWNAHSRMFMYPPAFDFSKGNPGTVKYRFDIHDNAGQKLTFYAPSQQASLAPVWDKVAVGPAFVWVSAYNAKGEELGIPGWPRDRFSRQFWRSAPFKPGTYPPAPRSYAEAVALCGDEIFSRSSTQYFLKTGKPDPDFKHNCYPSKMHSALIHGMLSYAKRRPEKAAEAIKLARIAADFLISISQPAGAPLEYFPPTYADRREAGSFRYGQNMLIYPCKVGCAYLALYEAVRDKKYLTAAERIADTYLKLQEEDGTWSVFRNESDGKVTVSNRVQPVGIVDFLMKLHGTDGVRKYRAAADRAFAWIEEHPLKTWFWEGQFEDSPLCQPYENPSKHMACEVALYLLERFPGDVKRRAVAREILRYAEDQFVCWEKPCLANGQGVNTLVGNPFWQQNRYDDWFFPCALEQYVYYVPVDAGNAKMIRTYLAMYRAEGNPLDLAKARALGDALVRIQQPSGYIPTEYAKVEKRNNPLQGWLNCTCATLGALAELAAFE